MNTYMHIYCRLLFKKKNVIITFRFSPYFFCSSHLAFSCGKLGAEQYSVVAFSDCFGDQGCVFDHYFCNEHIEICDVSVVRGNN